MMRLQVHQRRLPVAHLIRIVIDTSKRVFQVHGVDASEHPCLRKKLSRDVMQSMFKATPLTVIGIEACGSAHHWARTLSAMGHEVKLIAPQLAKPYVKRGKNDAADAEALCEAMSRPTMRFVLVKTAGQQAALLLASERARLVSGRTRLARVAADEGLPALARELFAGLGEEFAQAEERLGAADARLRAWHRGDGALRRLAAVPGIGPITASLLAMKVPDPGAFKSGWDFAAWLGLTPKDHSTAGRVRTGGITRAGDEVLCSLLVVGATSVMRHMRAAPPPLPKGRRKEAGQTGGGPARADAAQAGAGEAGPAKAGPAKAGHPAPGGPRPWLAGLLERKPPKLAAIALANKTARVAWKLLSSGKAYNPAHRHAPVPALAAA